MARSGPDRPSRPSRRDFLATVGLGTLVGLAGCGTGRNGITAEVLTPSGGGGGTSDGWGRHFRLTPTDEEVTHFGCSVALGGDAGTALVSATAHETGEGLKPGPASVLERTDDGWRQRARLVPEDGDTNLSFGWEGGATALSTDASTALVGADKADGPSAHRSGAAYVFERNGGAWDRQSKLLPTDGDTQDFFGTSVALSGDGRRALLGAPGDDYADGAGSGTVSVFERTDTGWHHRATLRPADGEGVGAFGGALAQARDGTTAIAGAWASDTPAGENAGTAYVFERDGESWRQRSTLTAEEGHAYDFFGGAVALGGETAIIGAPGTDDPHGTKAGSAYVFERVDGSWRQQAKLVADDGDETDLFGAAVAVSGDGRTALIGARVDEDPNGDAAGSTYIFERPDTGWRQQAKLVPADGASHDVFGRSVALVADTALIGTARGKAYVF